MKSLATCQGCRGRTSQAAGFLGGGGGSGGGGGGGGGGAGIYPLRDRNIQMFNHIPVLFNREILRGPAQEEEEEEEEEEEVHKRRKRDVFSITDIVSEKKEEVVQEEWNARIVTAQHRTAIQSTATRYGSIEHVTSQSAAILVEFVLRCSLIPGALGNICKHAAVRQR